MLPTSKKLRVGEMGWGERGGGGGGGSILVWPCPSVCLSVKFLGTYEITEWLMLGT